MSRQNLSTSNSKNSIFLVAVKLFAFCAALLAVFWTFISPQYLYDYNASLMDKMERLNTIDQPKIVLIGNSNLAFGIRSQLIEEAFDMEVVNMGLHGGLGNAFHEEMAKENLNPGDIVIVCHTEFPNFDKVGNPALAWLTIENHPQLWCCVPARAWYDMVLAFPTYAKNCINLFLWGEGNHDPGDTCYSRLSFNEYGDNIYSTTHEVRYTLPDDYTPLFPTIEEPTANRLNELNRYITDKGATLLIAGYPIPFRDGKDTKQPFLDFQAQLESLVNCPVISNYTDYLYPEDLFYDGIWHLNEDGAIIRTDQLIKDLKAYFDTRS